MRSFSMVLLCTVVSHLYCMSAEALHTRECAAVSKIREIVAAAVVAAKKAGEISRYDLNAHTEPQPFTNMTQCGLYLVKRDGLWSELWTPWGRLPLLEDCTGNFQNVNTYCDQHAEISSDPVQHVMWQMGDVYKIHQVAHISLPVAQLLARDQYPPAASVLQRWHARQES